MCFYCLDATTTAVAKEHYETQCEAHSEQLLNEKDRSNFIKTTFEFKIILCVVIKTRLSRREFNSCPK